MGKVFCPGELLIDFICTNRDSTLVQGTDFIKKAGGAPANVCAAICKLGSTAVFVGSVGNDPFGKFLIDILERNHVDTSDVTSLDSCFTTLAFVSIKADGERDFIFNRGADAYLSFDMIHSSTLQQSNVFHFGSATAFLGGKLEATYFQALDYAIANHKIISFDPNYRAALFQNKIERFTSCCQTFIKNADILKVSDEEAELITGKKDVETAAKTLNDMGANFVLVTLGSTGTMLVHDGKATLIPSIPVKMIDATGAGDAFIGAVLAKIAESCSSPNDISLEMVTDYVSFGNRAGAATVQSYGAIEAMPNLQDIETV